MCAWGTTTDVRVLIAADLAAEGVATWKEKPIDACIAPLVAALQVGRINMHGSCCGHGKGDGEILLAAYALAIAGGCADAEERWMMAKDLAEMFRAFREPTKQ